MILEGDVEGVTARVHCKEHGPVELSAEEYERQLDDSDAKWQCPICKQDALHVDFIDKVEPRPQFIEGLDD